MGEIITATTLNPPAPAIAQVIAPGTPIPTNTGGFSFDLKDIKEVLSTIKDAMKEFKEIQQMRQSFQQPPQPQVGFGTPDSNPPPLPTANPIIREEIKMISTAKIDRTKLRALVSDLIVNQAKNIPDDLKSRPIGDIVGDNWKTFSYKYKDFANISSEFLEETITEQFGKALDLMIVTEEKK